MTMGVGHPEATYRIALEVELDQHDRLVADDPTVMARRDLDNLRRFVFRNAAIAVRNVDLPRGEEAGVRVHTEVGSDRRFHVDRPAESRRVDHALDAPRARTPYLEPDVAD